MTHEHQSIEHRGNEVERKLHFPAHLEFVIEHPADHRADDHAGRPAGVEDVEIVRPILREKSRYQWIGDSLKGTVREREKEHAPIKEIVSALGSAGPEGDERGKDVENQGQGDQLSITDFIYNQSTENNSEAEARKSGATDCPQLRGREAEFLAPVVENPATNGKT